MTPSQPPTPPRIESLKVKNFRVLQNIELSKLTPLTVLIGSNGSGKSTVFDVFAFLSECFREGLRQAWDRRGRDRELRSRGETGPIVIEIKYRESKKSNLMTYHLSIDGDGLRPVVIHEWLQWERGSRGRPFRFLEYEKGQGKAVSGEQPDKTDNRVEIPLKSPDLLAVNALGQFKEHPRIAALREFITGWHISYLSAESARGQPEAGPQEQLSRTGDNLANVIQYLSEQHPDQLAYIFNKLKRRVPRIESVSSQQMPDGRLLLQIKDTPFDHPVLAKFTSDGTLKMLQYLVLLHDPNPPPFIGLEEPENFLHHRLLKELAEECRIASGNTQILVTTHSPYFLDALKGEEVRLLWRSQDGFSHTERIAGIRTVEELTKEGGQLGELWYEGYFEGAQSQATKERGSRDGPANV